MNTITTNTIDTTVNTIIDNTTLVSRINTITNNPINIINLDEQILPTNLDHQDDEQEPIFL